jgi:2-iminobutanoate/2-iminopropanoate deaminase
MKEIYKHPRLGGFPISTSVKAGNFIYTSGHAGLKDEDGNDLEDIKSQTSQCLRNIEHALDAFETKLEDVIKVTIYLKNSKDFREMNEVYSSFFKKDHPTRTTIVTDLVNPEMLIEIECVAYNP